ncbi:MAG: hypothetical protein ACOC8Y_05880 [Candidatus Natronoplasma sp.]
MKEIEVRGWGWKESIKVRNRDVEKLKEFLLDIRGHTDAFELKIDDEIY